MIKKEQLYKPWWCNGIEMIFLLLSLCEGNAFVLLSLCERNAFVLLSLCERNAFVLLSLCERNSNDQ